MHEHWLYPSTILSKTPVWSRTVKTDQQQFYSCLIKTIVVILFDNTKNIILVVYYFIKQNNAKIKYFSSFMYLLADLVLILREYNVYFWLSLVTGMLLFWRLLPLSVISSNLLRLQKSKETALESDLYGIRSWTLTFCM